ncbi:MAG: hypothetical protein WBG32_01965 [Nodosilinea sp.]
MFTISRFRFIAVSCRNQVSSFGQRLGAGFGVAQSLHALARRASQTITVAMLAMVLWLGAAGTVAQPAQAADNLDARGYEAEAVRQSRNPLSNENYSGGVDPRVAAERGQAPEDQARGILGTVKDAVQDALPGNGGDNLGQNAANPNAQPSPTRNPTLKRYDAGQ